MRWESPHYRGFTIWFDPPPIPDRQFDWHYQHDDFDGAPNSGDHRYGHCVSYEACLREIDDHYDEEMVTNHRKAEAA